MLCSHEDAAHPICVRLGWPSGPEAVPRFGCTATGAAGHRGGICAARWSGSRKGAAGGILQREGEQGHDSGSCSQATRNPCGSGPEEGSNRTAIKHLKPPCTSRSRCRPGFPARRDEAYRVESSDSRRPRCHLGEGFTSDPLPRIGAHGLGPTPTVMATTATARLSPVPAPWRPSERGRGSTRSTTPDRGRRQRRRAAGRRPHGLQ